MTATGAHLSPGSLYLVAFAQARSPHAGLIIPEDDSTGILFHIRIDRKTSPNWAFQVRRQRIAGEMAMTSLLQLCDVSKGGPTAEQLKEAASTTYVPENDEFGECVPWVFGVIQRLQKMDLLSVVDIHALQAEFEGFAAGNQSYARRDKFPNVAVSIHCS